MKQGIPTGLTVEKIQKAITEYHGNVAMVARSFKVSRETIYRFVRKYVSLQKALEEERENMRDNVESVLYNAALGGEAWAVQFFLKTQARDRGYSDRVQNTNANIDIDLTRLTDDQLLRIARGEDVYRVLADRSG